MEESTFYINMTNEMISNEMITNEMISNEMISNETVTNKQEEILKNIQIELINNFNTTHLESGKDIIIKEEEITFTISTSNNQKSLKNTTSNVTIIDLNECEKKLIQNKIIQENQTLYILKLDIHGEGMKTPNIEYEVYYYPENETNLSLLNLSFCGDTRIDVILPINISKNEMDKYNASSTYYNDICHSFTTEADTDISLKDRQIEYNENNMSVCEENCEFSEYDYNLGKAVCSCLTKTKIEKISDIKINKKGLYSNFKSIVNIANLELIKCAYLLFNKNGFINNSANYIILTLFIFSIITLTLFITREYIKLNEFIDKVVEIKKSKENGVKKIKKKIIKVIKKRKKVKLFQEI